MVKVSVRKETNKLLFDFYYMTRRCREQTALPDSPANRKKLEAIANRINAEIILGQFDYARYFPNSPRVEEFKRLKQRSATNHDFNSKAEDISFEMFANTWYEEMNIAWRDSYRRNVKILLFGRIMERLGHMPIAAITKSELLSF